MQNAETTRMAMAQSYHHYMWPGISGFVFAFIM
jgi:hypothetical protein